MHTKLLEYFKGLPGTENGLNARRLLSPALHASISEALTNFAAHIAPGIVEKHKGTLIYSGGDDVLALLPVCNVLRCAEELYRAFRGEPGPNFNNGAPSGYYRKDGRDLLVMGEKATLSAGIAVVHYKEDLRFALDAARAAERCAKESGRNALCLAVCRRSGEHTDAILGWDYVPQLQHLVTAFMGTDGASDRWAYHLRAELETLKGLDNEAIKSEIKRQVNRAEIETRKKLACDNDDKKAGEYLASKFEQYRKWREEQANKQKNHASLEAGDGQTKTADALQGFITLCQSASFLARGRDS